MSKKVIALFVILLIVASGVGWWFFLSPQANLRRCARLDGPSFLECLSGILGRELKIRDCEQFVYEDVPVLYDRCVSELAASVEDCEFYRNPEEQAYCKYPFTADFSACTELSLVEKEKCEEDLRYEFDCAQFQSAMRDDCYFNKAKNVEDCELISNEGFRTRCRAVVSGDIVLCRGADDVRECEYALFDIVTDCSLFETRELHDDCVFVQAKSIKDCRAIKSSERQIYCEALRGGDAKKCAKLSERWKTQCQEILG